MKFNYFQNRSKNDVFRNMLILAIGAGGAQVINLASMPILTRIYMPEDFGVLSIFMASVALILPFTTFRYNIPLPLLKKDGIAINLLILSIVILLSITLLTTFVLMFFNTSIFNTFSIESLIPYWWLFPIAVFSTGMFEILNSWSIRKRNFKAISKANTYQTLASAVVKIMLGLLNIKPMGLLIGAVTSNIYGTFFLLISNLKNIKENIVYIKKSRIIFLLNRYIEYPKYRLLSQFLLVLSKQAPLLFLAFFYTSEVVGYFGLTVMALSLPFTIFGNTTGQAYYSEISKIGRKNPIKIYEVTIDVIKKLFLFSLLPFIILLTISPWLFSFVFGQNWNEAGVYASIMSFYMLTAFISAPLANALSVFENQLLFLKLNIIRTIVLGIIFYICWIFSFSATEAITAYSIGMSLYFIYLSIYILNVIKNRNQSNPIKNSLNKR